MNLHDLHRRRLESTVELIEAGLVRMERALLEAGRQGIVQAVDDTLASGERDLLIGRIRQLRAALAAFAETFALEQRPLDVRQILNAEVSTIWVMLENCRPKRMKGYGVELEEAQRRALDESVDQLVRQVNGLRSLLRVK